MKVFHAVNREKMERGRRRGWRKGASRGLGVTGGGSKVELVLTLHITNTHYSVAGYPASKNNYKNIILFLKL